MKRVKLVALIAGVIAALGVYFFLKEIGKPQEIPRTAVVVAVVDIAENTRITENMVELREVADESLQPNHLLELKSAVGLVSSGEIFAGEQVITDRLVRTGELDEEYNTLAYVVENGMRAITVSVNTVSGLENMLKPGNRVDLILLYTYEEEADDPADTSSSEEPEEEKADEEPRQIRAARLLVQNKKLLAVGDEMSKQGAAEYVTITLETTPEEALLISYAEFTGSLRAILRSPLDNEPVVLDALDQSVLLGEATS